MREDAAIEATSERIREVLEGLVRERQRLRDTAESGALLEANRRSIAYWQARLGTALVAERGVKMAPTSHRSSRP